MYHYLSIYGCPHGVRFISLDSQSDVTRLTPMKCCGSWSLQTQWSMSKDLLERARDAFDEALKESK